MYGDLHSDPHKNERTSRLCHGEAEDVFGESQEATHWHTLRVITTVQNVVQTVDLILWAKSDALVGKNYRETVYLE